MHYCIITVVHNQEEKNMLTDNFWGMLIIQGIGFLGIIASILSFQCKKHGKLMVLRTGNELLFGIQYVLLGAYTGAAMNLVGCVRNLVFAGMVKKGKKTTGLCFLFSALFLTFAAVTWAGFRSVLIGTAKVISTFAYGNKNVFLVRIMVLSSSTAWLIYNAIVGSWAGVANETLTICSIIIGIFRIDIPEMRAKRANAAALESEEK